VLPKLFPALPWSGVVDSSPIGLSRQPLTAFKMGKFHKVPMIIGSNGDEGTIFLKPMGMTTYPATPTPYNTTGFAYVLNHFFNASTIQHIFSLYPEADYPTVDWRANKVLRDFFFTCDTRRAARALAAQGVDVWIYRFNYTFGGFFYERWGDFHMSELNFVWGNKFPPFVGKWDANHTAMSNTFQTFWTNLAKTGNPNSDAKDSTPNWPKFAQGDSTMILDVPSRVVEDLAGHVCDFFDSVTQKPDQPGE